MLDLRPIFRNSKLAQRVQVLRRQGQYLPDGTWQQESVLDTVLAIIHPTTPDDLQLLPEGERHHPSKKIMSQDQIDVGDVLLYQDTRWRITQLSNWSEYGYYRGIAVGHDGTAQPAAAAFVTT
ncbi:hypothetical protein XFUD_07205 [Xylella fastidiosa]|nr:hypothetical protein [Xylella fastidiosa]ALQ94898.1 hypothetical protein XFUD_06710 [Xylella fastidiosa]ALQ94979.1 hypothetical protein XFUD_07205 [Xylella fastidiosa]ETE32451.1 hypothetical protein B398_05790 [Xylella fastidiosa 32]KXB22608.1 hypothetical protein ADT30_00485 [Xylella fastidiosa]